MKPFEFKCRAADVEHSCRHGDDSEPDHDANFLNSVEDIIESIRSMQYTGVIKSPANSYQIGSSFDSSLLAALKTAGWSASRPARTFGNLQEISDIKPDAILSKDNIALVVEIEKSNKNKIWFDLIKFMMLIGDGTGDFGILMVPRNWAHKRGTWDLFYATRYYRWCLAKFAEVPSELLSKIAIIGYSQEAEISGNWVKIDKSSINEIKNKAREHFARKAVLPEIPVGS